MRCLEIIKEAVIQAGGKLEEVIRTRLYVTNMAHWEEIGRAHGDFLHTIRPASTLVEVKGFIRSDWLVEIEAECVVSED